MTVNSAAVVTMNFVSGMCDCTVDSDVGMGDFLLVARAGDFARV